MGYVLFHERRLVGIIVNYKRSIRLFPMKMISACPRRPPSSGTYVSDWVLRYPSHMTP